MSNVTTFQQPHPMEELGGNLGLTSDEIALSLGVRHEDVKLHARSISKSDPTFAAIPKKVPGTGGRPREIFLLNVDDAKLLVGTYRNKIGLGYARFLINLERATPALVAQIREMERQIADLEAQINRKVRTLPHTPTIPVTTNVTRYDSMHGDGQVFHRTRIQMPTTSLTELELLRAKRAHLIQTMEGLVKRVNKIEDQIDFLEQPPAQRLRVLKKTD